MILNMPVTVPGTGTRVPWLLNFRGILRFLPSLVSDTYRRSRWGCWWPRSAWLVATTGKRTNHEPIRLQLSQVQWYQVPVDGLYLIPVVPKKRFNLAFCFWFSVHIVYTGISKSMHCFIQDLIDIWLIIASRNSSKLWHKQQQRNKFIIPQSLLSYHVYCRRCELLFNETYCVMWLPKKGNDESDAAIVCASCWTGLTAVKSSRKCCL